MCLTNDVLFVIIQKYKVIVLPGVQGVKEYVFSHVLRRVQVAVEIMFSQSCTQNYMVSLNLCSFNNVLEGVRSAEVDLVDLVDLVDILLSLFIN